MSQKVLILYTSIGLGHKSIAENIGWQLQTAGFEVQLADVLKTQSGKLVDVSTWMHSFINRRLPFIWSALYWLTNAESLTKHFRVSLAKSNSANVVSLIKDFQPDLVISTQTTGSAIMSYLKRSKSYTGLFAIAFSDFHLHRYWLYDEADFYLANIPEQKTEMVALGIPENKIYVVGMTLKSKPVVDEVVVKQSFQIPPTNKVVLMASGSLGIGSSKDSLLKTIRAVEQKIVDSFGATFIIVCGKNTKLQTELDQVKNPDIITLGFYESMDDLYAISSVFVSKPGGLSTAESLQWCLPLIATHFLPGQEKLNYDYLVQKKLIIPAAEIVDPQTVASIIVEELRSRAWATSLIHNPALVELMGQNKKPAPVIAAVESAFHSSLTPAV